MSSQISTSTGGGDEQDVVMDIDSDSESRAALLATSTITENDGSLAVLLQDTTSELPQVRALKETDLMILLTPVVTPTDRELTEVVDPFEPLGRALAKSHARVRHVPYLPRTGITPTHITFIQRGHAVILCLVAQSPQQIPLELIDNVFAAREHKPCILIICSSPTSTEPFVQLPLSPTTILTKGYSPLALGAAASLIFPPSFQKSPLPTDISLTANHPPQTWPITPFNPSLHIHPLHTLWTESLPSVFSLPGQTLSSLLSRPGYASHYIVRAHHPSSILGFAATYLTYIDKAGEDLLACLAIIIVHPSYRGRGIGCALHDHALREMGRTRGVMRFQLGGAFPRFLTGPLVSGEQDWFARRGWAVRDAEVVCDLILDFRDWKFNHVGEDHLTLDGSSGMGGRGGSIRFRPAGIEDTSHILDFVDASAKRMGQMGWFDQYAALMDAGGENVRDVIIGVEGADDDNIVAAALTYTPSCGSQIAANMPWAERIGDDVGGVTCICISDQKTPADILPQVIDACVKSLGGNDMGRMFLDGINIGVVEDLKGLGFREWAAYKSVWREI